MKTGYDAIIVGGGPSGATCRRAAGAGGMAGCSRREGAVPAAQGMRRIHFRNDVAAVAAVGRRRPFAGNRRTRGAPRRRLRRRCDGHRRTGNAHRGRGGRRPGAGPRAPGYAAAPARSRGRGRGVAAVRALGVRRAATAATIAPSSTRARARPARFALAADHRRAWLLGVRRDADAGLAPPAAPSDLFGFKAHFHHSALPPDLMPLLAFPGGYGGMVHTDGGRVSLSCCIRRDQLEQCRQRWPHVKAGAAVLAHIGASCKGVALALSPATLDGAWLSSGPLRTGIRTFGRDGIFAVGNAAAEAHPIVAEGISMAIQSATLLCGQLIARPDVRSDRPVQAGRSKASGMTMRWPGAGIFHGACTWPHYSRTCSCGPFPRASRRDCWSASRNS